MASEFDRCCALWAEATALRMRQARQQADLPAMELHAALSSMSPDPDVAARVVVLTAGGDLAGVVRLAAGDVERLLAGLGVTDDIDTGLGAEAEAFLAQGGEA